MTLEPIGTAQFKVPSGCRAAAFIADADVKVRVRIRPLKLGHSARQRYRFLRIEFCYEGVVRKRGCGCYDQAQRKCGGG